MPAATCDTQDALSGVKVAATVSVSGGTSNGVGTYTAKCSGGKDEADNVRADVTLIYKVQYPVAGISGILQPINSDNTSVFNRGKAVPVKFKLGGDEPSGFSYSGWVLRRQQVSCTGNFDAEDAIQEAIVENPSNGFRYDASADQYIYNANFSDKQAGTCWQVSSRSIADRF